MAKAFPKQIYITREEENTDDEYLSVREDLDSAFFDKTTPVAVYELVQVGQVKVTRTFETSGKSRRRQ